MEKILDNFKDIDITDKTILQEQFNYLRNQWYNCIDNIEGLNKKISELKEECLSVSTALYADPSSGSAQAVNLKLKSDDDYQKMQLEIECYEKGISILEEKLNLIKSDIRILSNSMYNKF